MSKNPLRNVSWIVKILLVVIYDIYGIAARLTSGNLLFIIIGLVQIFTANGLGLIWIIDLITILTQKEVTVLA